MRPSVPCHSDSYKLHKERRISKRNRSFFLHGKQWSQDDSPEGQSCAQSQGGATGGFTLVEVLVATVIVSLALAGMASVFVVSSKQGSESTNKMAASFHAGEVLEKLQASVADNPNLLRGSSSNPVTDPTTQPNLYSPSWHAGCDDNGDGVADRACYVLEGSAAPGITHVYDRASLPADFTSKYNGRITYRVVDNGVAGSPIRYAVTVDVNWTEANIR